MLLGWSSPEDRPPVMFEEIPKSGGSRMIARLSNDLASDYRRAVAPVIPRVEATFRRAVVAERVAVRPSLPEPEIVPTDLRDARARCRARARSLARAFPGPVILADVRACYTSIAPVVVERQLGSIGCGAEARRVRDVLERFGQLGVRGLPVGPRPSAVLANAVLAHVDEEIVSTGARHLRWVDDLAIFADDRLTEAILARVVDALGALGLSLAEEKCAIGDLSATRFGRSLVGPPRPGPAAHVDGSLG